MASILVQYAECRHLDGPAAKKRRAEILFSVRDPLPMIDYGEGFEKMMRGECERRMCVGIFRRTGIWLSKSRKSN